MRTHEFEFKKTVKRVKKFKAISIDLTVEEAEALLQVYLDGTVFVPGQAHQDSMTVVERALGDMREQLEDFVEKNGGTIPVADE